MKFLGTTQAIQGKEVEIGLTSGVVRIPADANKGLRFTASSKNIAVNTTRAKCLDIYVANFGPAVDALHKRQRGQQILLAETFLTTYRKLIEHLHDLGSIISSDDMIRAVMGKDTRTLIRSSFQTAHNFKLSKSGKKAAVSSPLSDDGQLVTYSNAAQRRPAGIGKNKWKRMIRRGEVDGLE